MKIKKTPRQLAVSKPYSAAIVEMAFLSELNLREATDFVIYYFLQNGGSAEKMVDLQDKFRADFRERKAAERLGK